MSTLEGIIERIKPLDPSAGQAAQARLDDLTKPLGSLGRLEELARRLAEIRGTAKLAQPLAAVAVFAADHGVAQAGVSPYPAEVTPQMVFNFLAGGAGINVLARHSGAQVRVVDVGVNYDFDDTPGLIKAKVAKGTANLMQEPAMTLDQARQAIAVGSQVAAQLIEEGHDLLIAGDMGIGNTTPCAALTSVLCGQPVAAVTGRGAGLDETGLVQKIKIIEQALELHQPSADKPLEALAAVGGLEIAAICGYILEAAAQGGAGDPGRLHSRCRCLGGFPLGSGGGGLPFRRALFSGDRPPGATGSFGAGAHSEPEPAPGRRHRRGPGP